MAFVCLAADRNSFPNERTEEEGAVSQCVARALMNNLAAAALHLDQDEIHAITAAVSQP